MRRRDSGESDRRVTALTRELGKIDVVMRGARKGASRLTGGSDPLCVARWQLAVGPRQRFVVQSQPLRSFRGLRDDYDRLTMALALLELAAAIIPDDRPEPEAFDALVEGLGYLESHPKPVVAYVWCQTRLLAIEGFLPSFDYCMQEDTHILEAESWFSPRAGGYVTANFALQFSDRLKTRAEVLLGLARIVELDAPPPNLKFAVECAEVLAHHWRHIADRQLPATDSCIQSLKLGAEANATSVNRTKV